MSIYTYKISKSISLALGIDSIEQPSLSDQILAEKVDSVKLHYLPLGVLAWTGQHHTQESKDKISDALKKHKRTESHRLAISESAKLRYEDPTKHPSYGKKGKQSSNFGKKYKTLDKIECPHCKEMVASNNIKRYHYDKCKWKCI